MQLHALIEKLGYSPHEAAVYLAALELGGSTETQIAVRAKLARTTVASVVLALQRKGLLSAYLKGRRKIWGAENPDKFLTAIGEREVQLRAALPQLHSLRQATGPSAAPRSFSGSEEIKRIMSDILETKHHVFAVLSWDDWTAFLGKRFLDRFVAARKKRFLRIHLLTPKTPLSESLRARDAQDMRVTQFLPDGMALANVNFIYGDKLAIISLRCARPTGVLFQDADVHHTAELRFESLWLRSGGTLDQLS